MTEPLTHPQSYTSNTSSSASVTSVTFTWGPKQDEDPPAGVREPRKPKTPLPSMAAEAEPETVDSNDLS
jgi:hypothetical protein